MVADHLWIGLDTGIDAMSVCAIDQTGAVVSEARCSTTFDGLYEVLSWLDGRPIKEIAIEAGVGTHLVRELRAAGHVVRVYETRRSSKFLAVRRQKTDATDARGLAELARVGRTIGSTVFVKSLEAQNIRTRLAIRQSMIRQRQALEALAQSVVRLHGGNLKLRYARGAFKQDMSGQIDTLDGDGLEFDRDLAPLVQLVEDMRSHQRDMDRDFMRLAKSHPVCGRLLSVPGVGPITALSFYSAVQDPSRFARVRDVGAYLGLTPSVRQSGVSAKHGRISRMGSKMTRTHLVGAATVLISNVRKESELRAWGLELAKRIGRGKARVALARKLAVVMLAMWKDETEFRAEVSAGSFA